MDERIVFLFLFLLFMSPLVSAVKPTQTGTGDTGIDIRAPPVDFVKSNVDVTVHTHAFNKSDGLPLNSTTTTCYLDVYNRVGDDILEVQMVFIADDPFDWEYEIKGGNFTTIGEYGFLILCNTSEIGGGGIGGFTSGAIEVTGTGLGLTEGRAVIYASFFFILVFLFVITPFGINMLPSSNTQDEEGKILSVSYLKYFRSVLWFFEWILLIVIFFIASNLGFVYLGETLFANIFFTLYKISFGITPVIITVWVIWFFVKFFHDLEFQKMLNRGMFPQGKL